MTHSPVCASIAANLLGVIRSEAATGSRRSPSQTSAYWIKSLAKPAQFRYPGEGQTPKMGQIEQIEQ